MYKDVQSGGEGQLLSSLKIWKISMYLKKQSFFLYLKKTLQDLKSSLSSFGRTFTPSQTQTVLGSRIYAFAIAEYSNV